MDHPELKDLDPFGAVKPLEKQKSSNHVGRASSGALFDSAGSPESPPTSPVASTRPSGLGDRLLDQGSTSSKIAKFQKLMSQPTIDLSVLRRVAWSGCPSEFRVTAW